MKIFRLIWIGQLVSLLGSGLTAFALGVWVYQQTGSTTKFALVLLAGAIPGVLLLPVAGLLADRWDRRLTMILSDAGAAACTLALALAFFIGEPHLWLIYPLLMLSSALGTFQRPAYSAAIGQLVAKDDLGRANGLVRTAQAVAMLLAPLGAGILLDRVGIRGILLLDLATFGVAVATLSWVRSPPLSSGEEVEKRASWRAEISGGLAYVRARSGLLSLLAFLAVLNFSGGLAQALAQPLILSFTSATALGTMFTVGGLGLLVGSVLMSVWGGPKRRVLGIFAFMPLAGLGIFLAGVQPSVPLVTAALCLTFFTLPFIEGSTSAIVQSKVDPKVQGRVFAVTHMIAGSMAPLAYLVAGPLSDRLFEPMMAVGGPLSDSVGALIGVGPGRGIALLMMVLGAGLVLTTAVAFLSPRLRNIESELPDMLPCPAPSPFTVELPSLETP